jgi:hypothetical protein
MRVESTRTLVLPISPDEAWRTLGTPAGLAAMVPEIEHAWSPEEGVIELSSRIARRRRVWRAAATFSGEGRHIALVSQTPDVPFQFEATVEAHAEGCQVRTALSMQPPAHWIAPGRPPLVPRGSLQRLVISSVCFTLSVALLVLLPSLALSPVVSALAYALLGALFLAAVSLLSSAHRRQQWGPWLGGGRVRAMLPEPLRT